MADLFDLTGLVGKRRDSVIKHIGDSILPGDSIEKAVNDDLNKAFSEFDIDMQKSEGSRGGKVIGHTKSGKPVYGKKHESYKNFTHQDHVDAYDKLNKHYKDDESKDANDELAYHINEGSKKQHQKSVKKSIQKDRSTILSYYQEQDPEKFSKIISRHIPADCDDIIKSLNDNPHVEQIIEKLHTTFASDDNDIQKSFDGLIGDVLQKAEGSKGGKVIGHTKSGKPVYESQHADFYHDFTKQDHRDAYNIHEKKREKYIKIKDNTDLSRVKRAKAALMNNNHTDHADAHGTAAHKMYEDKIDIQKSFTRLLNEEEI